MKKYSNYHFAFLNLGRTLPDSEKKKLEEEFVEMLKEKSIDEDSARIAWIKLFYNVDKIVAENKEIKEWLDRKLKEYGIEVVPQPSPLHRWFGQDEIRVFRYSEYSLLIRFRISDLLKEFRRDRKDLYGDIVYKTDQEGWKRFFDVLITRRGEGRYTIRLKYVEGDKENRLTHEETVNRDNVVDALCSAVEVALERDLEEEEKKRIKKLVNVLFKKFSDIL